MYKKISTIGISFLLGVITFSGCISTDNVTAEEIMDWFIDDVGNVTSYKYSATSIGLWTSINETGTSTMESSSEFLVEVDILNKKQNIELSATINSIGDKWANAPGEFSQTMYFDNDSMYTIWFSDNLTWHSWGGDNVWYAYAVVERQAYFIIENSDLERLDDQRVDGMDCYVLDIIAPISVLELKSSPTDFLFSQGLSDERYLEVEVKYWISKDTNLLKKAYFKTLTDTTGIISSGADSTTETVLQETEVLFYDYNIPVFIEPPWQPYIDEAEETLDHLEYINTEYGYGLNPPQNWIIDDYYSGDFELKFLVEGISDLHLSINPPYKGLGFSQEDKNLSSEVARLLEYYTNDTSENVTLVSHSERIINGIDAYEFVIDSTYYGSWKIKRIYVEKGDRLFELEFKTLPEYYDTYVNVVDESIDSFMCVSPYYSMSI